MEAASSFERVVHTYQTTRYHNLENRNIYFLGLENLKPDSGKIILLVSSFLPWIKQRTLEDTL
jgi:hypothetical protein